MKIRFNQFETIDKQPERLGWYNTDKGLLYWWGEPFVWSCREDRISEEYPKYWYEKIIGLEDIDIYAKSKWDEGCRKLLSDISETFLSNINKADKESDKDVFQAIGETIKNFPIPNYNLSLHIGA